MGAAGGPGGPAAGLNARVRAAYDAAAARWARGPEPVYASLARALLACVASPADGGLAGQRVLDAGAGTGVAGQAALAAGARSVVCVDGALAMLSRAERSGHPVVADLTALPFRDASFDLVLAAFCLGHLDRPAAALAEGRRVAARLVASSFAASWNHPAKAAVDEVLSRFGYQPPTWYVTFKRETEPWASEPDAVSRAAAAAGFTGLRWQTVTVDTGLDGPDQLAAWRLGMAHIAPFVGSLPAVRQAELVQAAAAAAAGTGPLTVSMLVLSAS